MCKTIQMTGITMPIIIIIIIMLVKQLAARRFSWRVIWTAGVSMLYVHTLAVNEKARDLYAKCGYEIHAEESANHAKNRGGCLDGVEGRARILVMSKALV
jgi:hypothetical protein